jgi:predicted MFS family arabinose efflux permease
MQSLKKPILLWSLATLFFAFQFILRLTVGILREDIIQKFAIDTIAFGTLAGYYYLGYAGMLIPIGILLDKFNFRVITFLSILVATIGTLTFALATDWHYLLLGRFLTGAGSAVGFLSIVKITKTYFPANRHSLIIGLSFTFGLTGAVFGVTPMKMLFNHFGYNATFYCLALTGFIIGLLILTMNTNSENEDHLQGQEKSPGFKDITRLLLNPQILIIGISGGLMVGSLEGFTDVWAIPYFKDIYKMSEIESNFITSCVYIGMCFGGPILALLADFFKSINFMIFLAGLLMIIIFLILFYVPDLSFIASVGLMFLLGIVCCYQVLMFTLTTSIVDKAHAGLAVAIVNCINMSFGHFFHKVMSITIEYSWDGTLSLDNIPVYTKENYIEANAVVPICCLIGIFGFYVLSKQLKKRNHQTLSG